MTNPSDEKLSLPLVNAAIFSSSYKSIAPSVQSIGLRTNGLRYRSLTFAQEQRTAEEFLLNTRVHRHDREMARSVEHYFVDQSVAMLSLLGQESTAGLRTIKLSPGIPLSIALGSAITQRRSCRSYTGDPLDFDELSALLHSVGQVTGIAKVHLLQGGEASLRFRSVPSGGGLYPVDLYWVALNVAGLNPAVYKYLPVRDELVEVGDAAMLKGLLRCFSVPEELLSIGRAAGIFVMVGQPWRSMRKYGGRGTRFMLMEVGAMSEHLHLAAVALGLGSVDCSSYYDDEMDEVLGFDGLYQMVLHTVVLGTPA
jgi:SagB-type dehydrogenase family enzyme